MALTKSKKKELLGELDIIAKAKTIVFVKFDRLNVKDTLSLRRSLKADETSYRVVKKTLLKRTLDEKKIEGTLPELLGEIAIAWGEDMLAPARSVYGFQKTHKDLGSIAGGVFDGMYKSQTEMLSIATIPPMDVLRGMFVRVINSPLQRFAMVLSEKAKVA